MRDAVRDAPRVVRRTRSAQPYDHAVVTTDLTMQQHLELQFKASSSNDLIDDGLRTIRSGRLTVTNRDQVLASLAAGLSRLYILLLDLQRLEPDHPPKRRESGAEEPLCELGLADLHTMLFDLLGLHPGRSRGTADQWLCRLSADPVVITLVEALDEYRDTAAGSPSDPDAAWTGVRRAVDLDPGVLSRRLRSEIDDGNPQDRVSTGEYEKAWGDRLVAAVEGIRTTIDVCSREGLLGGPAQNLGGRSTRRRHGPMAA